MHSSSILITPFVFALALAVPTSENRRSSDSFPPNNEGKVNSIAGNKDILQKLMLAPSAVDRINLIPQNTDFVYDFDHPPENATTSGKGGHTVRADRDLFPALVGTGVSMTLGFLGPCGFNTPHIHPRSSEINVVVKGSLVAQHTLENRANTIINRLNTNQMTVFPKGAIHTEFNPGCEDALFVAGFADEDPGVQQTAQTFFGLEPDIVNAALKNDFTFEGKDVNKFRKLIPANVAQGVESCLKECGIKAG